MFYKFDNCIELKKQIRKLLDEKGLKMIDISKQLKINYSTVHYALCAKTPRFDTLKEIVQRKLGGKLEKKEVYILEL